MNTTPCQPWTNIYDTEPLRHTLAKLVDLEALADPKAAPGLLVSATDVEAEIAYFDSHDKGLSLDHIVASGSLPPWDAWSPCSRENMRAAWISARPARSPKGSLAPKCVHDSQEGIVTLSK